MNGEPFRKFSIVTTAGVRCQITDPNAVTLASRELHYCFPKSDRAVHLPHDQIATVEETAISKSKH